jgi:hypothetical protein
MEGARLYYTKDNQVMLRDSKGIELDITKGFPHQIYSSMKEESEETRYASGIKCKDLDDISEVY